MDRDPDEYVLEAQVGHLLRRAYQRHLALFQGSWARMGRPPCNSPRCTALAARAAVAEPARPGLAMDPPTVKGVVTRLMARGLVERDQDAADARLLRVALTPAAQAALPGLGREARAVTAATLAPLSREEAARSGRSWRSSADFGCDRGMTVARLVSVHMIGAADDRLSPTRDAGRGAGPLAAADRRRCCWRAGPMSTRRGPPRRPGGGAHARAVLDLSAIAGLAGIEDRGDHHRIGALVTWAALREAALPACFDGLRAAAAQVGGVQVQNRGTLVGNLCNASPAADGVPPLLALDAAVELASRARAAAAAAGGIPAAATGGRRWPRDEMAVAVLVPQPARRGLPASRSSGHGTTW